MFWSATRVYEWCSPDGGDRRYAHTVASNTWFPDRRDYLKMTYGELMRLARLKVGEHMEVAYWKESGEGLPCVMRVADNTPTHYFEALGCRVEGPEHALMDLRHRLRLGRRRREPEPEIREIGHNEDVV